MATEKYQICKDCGENKELSLFVKNPSYANGYRRLCKICYSVHSKKYRENNKDKIAVSNKLYYNKNYNKLKEYKKEYNKTEKVKQQRREYYHKNREKILEKRRSRRHRTSMRRIRQPFKFDEFNCEYELEKEKTKNNPHKKTRKFNADEEYGYNTDTSIDSLDKEYFYNDNSDEDTEY